jgi:phosphoesterase family protein
VNEKARKALGLGTVVAAVGILLFAGLVAAMGANQSPIGTNDQGHGPSGVPPGGSSYFPTPIRHVVTILLENEEASSVFTAGPYETYLAHHYTYTAQDYAVTHPSEPNYLALTGGSVFNRSGTDAYTVIPNESIADLLEVRGESWGEFAQSMPTPCDANDSYPYAVRHNPFVFYQDIVGNASRCDAHVVNFSAWNADVASGHIPNYAFITPNVLNDGHDTSVSYADAWLASWLPPLLTQPFASSTLFIVTYDEGATDLGYSVGNTTLGGGNVFTVLVSPYTLNGGFYAAPVSHYNLLTTTEWLLGLGSLGTNDSVITFPPMVTAFHFGSHGGGAGLLDAGLPQLARRT